MVEPVSGGDHVDESGEGGGKQAMGGVAADEGLEGEGGGGGEGGEGEGGLAGEAEEGVDGEEEVVGGRGG